MSSLQMETDSAVNTGSRLLTKRLDFWRVSPIKYLSGWFDRLQLMFSISLVSYPVIGLASN